MAICDGSLSSSGTRIPDGRLSPYRSVRCRLPAGRMSMVLSRPGEDRVGSNSLSGELLRGLSLHVIDYAYRVPLSYREVILHQ